MKLKSVYWYPEVNTLLRESAKARQYTAIECNRQFALKFLCEYRQQQLDRLETMRDLGFKGWDQRYEYQYSIAADCSYRIWFIDGLPESQTTIDNCVAVAGARISKAKHCAVCNTRSNELDHDVCKHCMRQAAQCLINAADDTVIIAARYYQNIPDSASYQLAKYASDLYRDASQHLRDMIALQEKYE